MGRFASFVALAVLSVALVIACASCKKGEEGQGAAAGRTIKSKTGRDVSAPLTLPGGGAQIEAPSKEPPPAGG